MKKAALVIVSIALVILTTIAGGAFLVYQNFANSAPSQDSQEVIYDLKSGTSFMAIAKDLEAKGLVTNALYFNYYARLTNQRNQVKAGEYQLFTNMTPKKVMEVITSGKSVGRAFTVSEGLSTFEIAELFERQGFGTAKEFLALTRDRAFIQELLGEPLPSLEGYLFPETYMLTRYTSTKTLIANMVKRFLVVYGEVIKQNSIGWTDRNRIVTLASIIEKETGAPEERPLISSVFHNRIQKKMKLQTDPTVIYGKAQRLGKIVISITRADLREPTSYNTYVIPELPPTAIANPGREALLATLNPAQSSYLFFVSQNDGTHVFSETYQQHHAAVVKFQLDRKAREGKSWRDLQKRTTNDAVK